MKKKSFNEISGAMSKAEMKSVVGGAQICNTKCYPLSSGIPVPPGTSGPQPVNCIYPNPAQPNVGCFCIYPTGYDQLCW